MATVDESRIQVLSLVDDDCDNQSDAHDQVVNENTDLLCYEICKHQSCSSLFKSKLRG